jgi:Sulfotransferase family
MISWLGAFGLVVAFVLLLRAFGLTERSRQVLETTRASIAIMRAPSMADEAKEAALQANAKTLLRASVVLVFGLAAALLLPAALLWVFDWMGWMAFGRVLAVSLSPVFLVISAAVAVVGLLAGGRAAREPAGYSAVDRALHRVAFATYDVQADLAKIEDRVYQARLGSCSSERPVFITSLPRAGTTLLLECCAAMPEFASHSYRDMPFVLIPCLWGAFSAGFRREGRLQPRAHGDGMQIDFDSPEALEEVLWTAFWNEQYLADRILPWPVREKREFTAFFARHMRKIVYLRRSEQPEGVRYISKNNLNIARVPLLRQMFADATIVVPVRSPLAHASSLLEQHRQFLSLHARDPFASRYMRAIGHFDFGAHLRPVDFDGWYAGRVSRDAQTIGFWLEYWVATFRHLLTRDTALVHLLDYDRLCADPSPSLRRLADRLALRDADGLLAAAARIRPARPRAVDTSAVAPEILREATSLHGALREAAGL